MLSLTEGNFLEIGRGGLRSTRNLPFWQIEKQKHQTQRPEEIKENEK